MSDNRTTPFVILPTKPDNHYRTLTFPKDLWGPEATFEDGAIYVLRQWSPGEYRLVRMRDEAL